VPYVAATAACFLRGGLARHSGRRPASDPRPHSLVAFLIANPYAVLDYSSFHGEVIHQSKLSAESRASWAPARQGASLLPLVAHLGPRLGPSARAPWWARPRSGVAPRRGMDAGSGHRCCSSPSWAHSGPISALVDADPADPLPAARSPTAGLRGARAAGRLAAGLAVVVGGRLELALPAPRPSRGGVNPGPPAVMPACWSSRCSPRACSTAFHPASCWPVPTAAP